MTDVAHEAPVGLAPPPAAPPFDRTQLQVVPVKALPGVAVVLAGLVAVIATNWGWGLDFFHVVGGGLWTAIDLFVGFIVGPIIGRMSIPSRSS